MLWFVNIDQLRFYELPLLKDSVFIKNYSWACETMCWCTNWQFPVSRTFQTKDMFQILWDESVPRTSFILTFLRHFLFDGKCLESVTKINSKQTELSFHNNWWWKKSREIWYVCFATSKLIWIHFLYIFYWIYFLYNFLFFCKAFQAVLVCNFSYLNVNVNSIHTSTL